MVIGIDKGTTYTKTSDKRSVRSTIRIREKNEINLNERLDIFTYEKKDYIIGERGNYSTDLLKADHLNTKILTLYMVAISSRDTLITSDIINGLPIALFSENKFKMKALFNDTKHSVMLNNKEKTICIKRCEVFPESAGAFFSQSAYKDALVIDIGGLSVDNSLFIDGDLKQYSTYSMGTMKLFNKIANYLNSSYDLSLREWDIEKVLRDGLYIYGKKQNINLSSILQQHALEIVERIKLEYGIKAIRHILVTGGGGELLLPYLKQYLPQVILLDNYIFANAIGYKRIGEKIL